MGQMYVLVTVDTMYIAVLQNVSCGEFGIPQHNHGTVWWQPKSLKYRNHFYSEPAEPLTVKNSVTGS